MKVLITGGRNYLYRDDISAALIKLQLEGNKIDVVIHGACPRGADALADSVADNLGLPVQRFPAHWRHSYNCPPGCKKTEGRAAGVLRNQQMLDEGKPDIVLAFPDPESRGTWDMVGRAKKAGIEVRVLGPNAKRV